MQKPLSRSDYFNTVLTLTYWGNPRKECNSISRPKIRPCSTPLAGASIFLFCVLEAGICQLWIDAIRTDENLYQIRSH